jgi:NitT/TauT family transport system ATP-binding protein
MLKTLQISNVNSIYANGNGINNIRVQIQQGEVLSVVGPSGCGKTTLLKAIAGIIPFSGSINKDNLRVGMVFQDPTLLAWLNVRENLILPRKIIGEGLSEIEIDKALDLVQLDCDKELMPHQLSGGMKMRLSFARALITNPDILLMDEPFAALDENLRFHLCHEVRKICRARNLIVVFVTHAISDALFMGDQIIQLDGRPATIKRHLDVPFAKDREITVRKNIEFINLCFNWHGISDITDIFLCVYFCSSRRVFNRNA